MIRNLTFNDKELSLLITALQGFNVAAQSGQKNLLSKLQRANKRIKVASAKGKGRNLQKWICEKIAKLLNLEWDNGDDSSLIASRPMGLSGCDVILRGEAKKRFPFAVECKSTESISLPAFIRQARENTPAGQYPLLVIKSKSLSKPLLCLEWDAFAFLYKGP